MRDTALVRSPSSKPLILPAKCEWTAFPREAETHWSDRLQLPLIPPRTQTGAHVRKASISQIQISICLVRTCVLRVGLHAGPPCMCNYPAGARVFQGAHLCSGDFLSACLLFHSRNTVKWILSAFWEPTEYITDVHSARITQEHLVWTCGRSIRSKIFFLMFFLLHILFPSFSLAVHISVHYRRGSSTFSVVKRGNVLHQCLSKSDLIRGLLVNVTFRGLQLIQRAIKCRQFYCAVTAFLTLNAS